MKNFWLALFFLFPFSAAATTYVCDVGASQGVASVKFTAIEGTSLGEIEYKFNSGLLSRGHVCRVNRIDSIDSFFCAGPNRLGREVMVSVLVAPASEQKVSVRFYDLESPELPDFGAGGPTSPCRTE